MVSAETGFFLSSDYGRNWIPVDKGEMSTPITIKYSYKNNGIAIVGSAYYLQPRKLFFISTDYGRKFYLMDTTLNVWPQPMPRKVELDPQNSEVVYFLLGDEEITETREIVVSYDGGKTLRYLYDESNSYLENVSSLHDISTDGKTSGVIMAVGFSYDNHGYLFISNDFGENWSKKKVMDMLEPYRVACYDNIILVHDVNNLALSLDGGKSFSAVDKNQFQYKSFSGILVTSDKKLIVAVNEGQKTLLYYSNDLGNTWKLLSSDNDAKSYSICYDSMNKFVYVVKNKDNMGFYRLKIKD